MTSNAEILPLKSRMVESRFSQDAWIVFHRGEAKELVSSLPSRSMRLVVTSPPYNLGKAYEKTRVELETYLKIQADIIDDLVRVLADNGSLCWQVGNYVEKGEVYPLDIFYYDLFKDRGLRLRNRIVWHFGHGLHANRRFSGRYETILWFTRSDDYVMNLDPVRVPSKYPGKRAFKGPKKGQPSGNPLGKNPSDFWQFDLKGAWEGGVWDVPNVKANHPEKTSHPCQFPVELVERCVLALTNEGDWVLDPYAGVGSSLIAAALHNRRVIGSDTDIDYATTAVERIELLKAQNLPLRPLGMPIHIPAGSVARVPDEWQNSHKETTPKS